MCGCKATFLMGSFLVRTLIRCEEIYLQSLIIVKEKNKTSILF